jgi:ferredoxin
MAKKVARRSFLNTVMKLPVLSAIGSAVTASPVLASIAKAVTEGIDEDVSVYGMGIQIEKCIGCGRCVEACKSENDVLDEPYFFRTWVERYIHDAGSVRWGPPSSPRKGSFSSTRTTASAVGIASRPALMEPGISIQEPRPQTSARSVITG